MVRKINSPVMNIGIVLSLLALGALMYVGISSLMNWKGTSSFTLSQSQGQQGQSQGQSHVQPSIVIINKDEAPAGDNPFIYENSKNLQKPPARPFYYPTRGVPQSYQQYGVLIGEERRHRGEQTILPLIGRQTHPGSSRYNYYTSTGGYHPMKLPVLHNKRTCNDQTGCDEIYSGNLVSVKGYDFDFKADIYPSPEIQYIA